MKTSIVISTYNRVNDLREALESILIQTLLPSEMIIVVDKGGNYDGNLSVYNEFKTNFDEKGIILKILKNNKRNNLAIARNIGVTGSDGDIVIFSDDDVVLEKDYVENIIDTFSKDNKGEIGGVAGGFIDVDLREDILKKDFLKRLYSYFKHFVRKVFLQPTWGNGKVLSSGFPTMYYGGKNKNKICYLEWTSGCNMAFRKEIFKEFKFDENIGYAAMEDLDFSFRVSKKYKILYTPQAKLLHNRSQTGRRNKKEFMKSYVKTHRYLRNENFPKDLKHSLAFFWSHYFGIPMDRIISRDIEGLYGTFIAFYEEFKGVRYK